MSLFDTTPGANRERSYDGDYMEAGRKAEDIIMDWLRRQPWVLDLDDLTGLRPMRQADVDCHFSLTDGRSTLAEIKSDKHLGTSKNYLFEVLRINHTAPPDKAVTLGWSARSPAKWLLYWAPNKKEIHQISMDEFRGALQNYSQQQRKETKLSYVPTDRIKSTVNILIPERFVVCRGTFKIHELKNEI